jgi:DNA helicase-2/ATP-dependent DNA helicase PcrA
MTDPGDIPEDPRIFGDLTSAQADAVRTVRGPLVILAGAGSGKTRVISRRAAHAIATGAVEPSRMLLVTFTDKAAREMADRLAALVQPRVMTRTFHAMALAQLRHFWPSRHGGAPAPEVLGSKARLLTPLARALPGHYRFTPVKDLADTIEWAKVRGIAPRHWARDGGERAPVPPDLFAKVYAGYEQARTRAGLIDYQDMLLETIALLEADEAAATLVRARKTWFSVDEYQDTDPLAERLLELWLGDSTDLAVVGDPEQTIYSFAGASPDHLLQFAERHPGTRTVRLLENYRSTPQVLALANRLTGSSIRGDLRAVRPAGPEPIIRAAPDAAAELASLVADIERLLALGLTPGQVAVLVRINAQVPPIEEALARAGIPYRSAVRFYEGVDVRSARRLLARLRTSTTGHDLVAAIRALFTEQLGLGTAEEDGGAQARERDAALEALLDIAAGLAAADPAVGNASLIADLDRRDAAEAAASGEGVELITYHRAKGLEWEAVLLPTLEEGTLPNRLAVSDDDIAEERRLLYVGITRARTNLVLSWAARREDRSGRETNRRRSRFLDGLAPTLRASRQPGVSTGAVRTPVPLDLSDSPLLAALVAWRTDRARQDAVPAYVIAPNTTLAAIAEARPGTTAGLLRVPGMGPSRVERYAAEILAIVAARR